MTEQPAMTPLESALRGAEAPSADVLVVGSGLAGMAAALEAAGQGASVVMASAGEGSSERAQGGIAAAVGGDDEPALHAADTLAAGAGLSDPQAVGILTAEAVAAVRWLERSGIVFDRDPDGGPALALEAAHSRPRVLHAGGDRSGAALVGVLTEAVRPLLRRLEATVLEGLLVDGGGVAGARLRRGGDAVEVRAGATVLATGGYAGLYPRTTTSEVCDGFGLVAALLAGAELADLEFVQFHPTAYAGPGPTFLLTEALRGAGAWLIDRRGRRFLTDTDPRGELAPRAVVSRAIAERLRTSGDACVFLDVRHLAAEELAGHFAGFLANCRRVGLDPLAEPVPVAPVAHYTMGGIVTGEHGHTTVPGLLAAGECARTGVHGANRLASNSLLEAIVFGRRAGKAAAAYAALEAPECPPREAGIDGMGGLTLAGVRAALGRGAGQLRDAAGLGAELEILAQDRGGDIRVEAARTLASLILRSALTREESRGAHVRTDHPDAVGRWAHVELVARRDPDGRVRLLERERPGATADVLAG